MAYHVDAADAMHVLLMANRFNDADSHVARAPFWLYYRGADAAKAGMLDALQWAVCRSGTNILFPWADRVATSALRNNHMHVVQWVLSVAAHLLDLTFIRGFRGDPLPVAQLAVTAGVNKDLCVSDGLHLMRTYSHNRPFLLWMMATFADTLATNRKCVKVNEAARWRSRKAWISAVVAQTADPPPPPRRSQRLRK
jgi:hypothetical protein